MTMGDSNQMLGFTGGPDADGWPAILGALAASCGLGLRAVSEGAWDGLAGVITVGAPRTGRVAPPCPECRIVPVAGEMRASVVRFGAGPLVPDPFRGRQVTTACVVPAEAEPADAEVLASADGRPVWVSGLADGQRRDTCWVAAGSLHGVVGAFDRLNGRRFMDLLPVLEWMRQVAGFYEWERPPLRASLMFDDPNLHARRYGYVDFQRIAEEGRRHGFHTAFATVPFDAWYVNAGAARIFREHRDSLSLLVHGNNHTHRELAGGRDPQERLALMRQALRRIERLDRESGVATARVMAPPHGACSEAMMDALRDAGFEAACISPASVRAANPDVRWAGSLGLHPAAVIGRLPVLPRFRLEPHREGSVWLAAYLDQPVIPVGHHWDLAGGLDLLVHTAEVINGLGDVVWGDVGSLGRRNYRSRIVGSGLWLQPFSRRLEVVVPENVDHLRIEAPWLAATESRCLWRMVPPPGSKDGQVAETLSGSCFPVRPGTCLTMELQPLLPPPSVSSKPPRTRPAVIARRLLVEVRDRAMPLLPEPLRVR